MTKTDIIKSHILKKKNEIKKAEKEIALQQETLQVIDAYYYASIQDNETESALEYLEKRMIHEELTLLEYKKNLYRLERDLKKLVNSLDS